MRAMHRLVDREPWVIDDPVSALLFEDAARRVLDARAEAFVSPRATALRGHVLVRSAFAEARMAAAVRRGIRQCVVLGAGYDTAAYRQPPELRECAIFEVDAPPTQHDKRARLAAAGVAIPPNVRFTPVDFETTSLADGLARAGFDPGAPAFFSWLGVTMYLTRDAIDGVLAFVAARPAGSEIVFTFTAPATGDGDALARRVAEAGEPLRTRMTADDVETIARAHGFRDVRIVPVEETRALLGRRDDGLTVPDRASLCSAVV